MLCTVTPSGKEGKVEASTTRLQIRMTETNVAKSMTVDMLERLDGSWGADMGYLCCQRELWAAPFMQY